MDCPCVDCIEWTQCTHVSKIDKNECFQAFKNLFPDGLIKKDGGFGTGFKKTREESHQIRMYKVILPGIVS